MLTISNTDHFEALKAVVEKSKEDLIVFHCSDGEVKCDALIFKVHSPLLAQVLQHQNQKSSDAPYSVMLPGVQKVNLINLINIISFGAITLDDQETPVSSSIKRIVELANILKIKVTHKSLVLEFNPSMSIKSEPGFDNETEEREKKSLKRKKPGDEKSSDDDDDKVESSPDSMRSHQPAKPVTPTIHSPSIRRSFYEGPHRHDTKQGNTFLSSHCRSCPVTAKQTLPPAPAKKVFKSILNPVPVKRNKHLYIYKRKNNASYGRPYYF